jgi:hypothetical protein
VPSPGGKVDGAAEGVQDAGVLSAPGEPAELPVHGLRIRGGEVLDPPVAEPTEIVRQARADAGNDLKRVDRATGSGWLQG